jgi:hypothetical protein
VNGSAYSAIGLAMNGSKGSKVKAVKAVKTLTVNGIPYSVNNNEVYMYGTSVSVGVLEGGKVVPQGSLDSYLAEYRAGLKEKTRAAMEKAKLQFDGNV